MKMGFFPTASYFTDSYQNIYICICQTFFFLFSIGIAFLSAIWLLYFLFRVRELSRKIHYLKKQTDERCEQELTNAKVDYIKSVFIAAICLSEVLQCIGIIPLEVSITLLKPFQPSLGNCTPHINFFFEVTYHFTYVRGFLAVEISSLLIYTSLVHILTSYLSNAYAEKRIIKLTKRELLMFLLLLTQLVLLWLSVLYWRAFLLFILVLPVSLFPIHLFLFRKYSRKLYILLKRRTLDAWFEQEEYLHKRLQQMCKEYKRGSILYAVAIALLLSASLLMIISEFAKYLFVKPCILNFLLFNSDYPWLSHVYSQYPDLMKVVFIIIFVIYNTLIAFATFFLFLLHASILYQAVRRLLNRRRAYNSYTGIHSHDIYKPLIGNK